ncbi:LysR substrate-binding domain-containing protein [Acinetobacter guillouiae]|uniref:LysR substrate-binding domain-containing protein n=1 Tax=Acinetobacter guillouiae TaxID=106649 RepID=UPI00148E9A2B|nr:LysR family transcriptional regulator [Acinetobacter guillouiae]MBP2543833.1 LysR family glycine cleavage system transcriptional activator [Acinetobacter guillouiae]
MVLHNSLEQLLAFQHVAEQLSFKKAADQLFLTPTALSHRIKKLEQQLNIQLFERRTRSISLTPEGEYLLKHVQSGFGQIQTALFQLEQNKQRLFTITTTPSFASEWIIPYLPELQSRFPNIMFRVHASYDLVNMTSGLYDLAIRYGSGGYQDVDAELFAVDEYVAVGHPSLDIATMNWTTVPLIHFTWGDEYCPNRVNWQKWFEKQGLHIQAGQAQVFYTQESHAIQAVLSGQGIALLSRISIANDLQHGRLKIVSPCVETAWNYYFLTLPDADFIVNEVKQWCKEKFSQNFAHE